VATPVPARDSPHFPPKNRAWRCLHAPFTDDRRTEKLSVYFGLLSGAQQRVGVDVLARPEVSGVCDAVDLEVEVRVAGRGVAGVADVGQGLAAARDVPLREAVGVAFSTGVPRGAMMSMASCTRPSLRASLKVSCNCSGLMPSTGMSRRIEASADAGSPERACACGEAPGEDTGVGLGLGGGEASGVGVGLVFFGGLGEGGRRGVAGCAQ
jgi:hypothetical protein